MHCLFNSRNLILSLSTVLSSCAFFTSTPEFDNEKLNAYVSGSGFDRDDLRDMKKHLTRKTKLAGSIYKVKAYPYTPALVEALVDDQIGAHSLTKKQSQNLREHMKEEFLTKKTCFHFEYEVTRVEKASNLKDWSLEITDHYKNIYKTQWIKTSEGEDSPAKSFDYVGSVREPVWLGEGNACTDQKVDLTKNFEVKVIAQYAPFPFSKEENLYWQYPVYEVVDGEKQKVEEKNKNYKGYRGW